MSPTWRQAAAAASLWFASCALADRDLFSDVKAFDKEANASGGFPKQRFRSSDAMGPVLQVNTWEKNQVDNAGYIFLGTHDEPGKAGPIILDASDLSLVYADQSYENTYSSDVVDIDGERLMGFWEGRHTRGHANGFCLIYDQHYNQRYNVSAQGLHGALADMHEMKMTKDKTVIFSTYFNIKYNCSSVGGPEDALLQDSGFQEVDMETNKVLFDWHASNHFKLKYSVARYSSAYGVTKDSGFDFFHINSVDKTPEGNYLISARHFSMIALIDGKDGHPIWILGGKLNQFKDLSDGRATNFGWQHDARFYNSTHITMFDNHGEHTDFCDVKEGKVKCRTRGLHLQIDTEAMTVRVVQEYYHPEHINSGAMGGFQHLDNGNVMLGWGYNPSFVEYKPDGTPVLDVQRGSIGKHLADMFAYRVNKGTWKGLPAWPPSIAVDNPENSTANGTVYLSWNGATEVRRWVVLAADHARELNGHDNIVARSDRLGFETTIRLPEDVKKRYLGAAAIDRDGAVLGSTVVIDMTAGLPFLMESEITDIEPVVTPKPAPTTEPVATSKPSVTSQPAADTKPEHVFPVKIDDGLGIHKVEQPSSSDAVPAGNAAGEEDGGDDDEEIDDGIDESSADFSSAAMMGASIFFFGAVGYAALYFWRKKNPRVADDHEKGIYSRITGSRD